MIARVNTDVASPEDRSPEVIATANPHNPQSGPHTRDGNGWIDGDDGTCHLHRQ